MSSTNHSSPRERKGKRGDRIHETVPDRTGSTSVPVPFTESVTLVVPQLHRFSTSGDQDRVLSHLRDPDLGCLYHCGRDWVGDSDTLHDRDTRLPLHGTDSSGSPFPDLGREYGSDHGHLCDPHIATEVDLLGSTLL